MSRELQWIEACQAGIKGLWGAQLKQAMQAKRAEYAKLFPAPEYSTFLGNVHLKALIDASGTIKGSAMADLEECIQQYAPLNILSVNMVMDFYRKRRMMPLAESMMESLLKNSPGVLPTRASFSTILAGWMESRNSAKVIAWYDRLFARWEAEGKPLALKPTCDLLSLVLRASSRDIPRMQSLIEQFTERVGDIIHWSIWRILFFAYREQKIANEVIEGRAKWLLTEYLAANHAQRVRARTDLLQMFPFLSKSL